MSQNLEWMYFTGGNDLTTTQLTTSVANAMYLIDDGTYIWATCASDGIAIFQYFGASTDHEPSWEELDLTFYGRYDSGLSKKLRLVTFIKITATQVIRTTCVPALSLFPALSDADPDGVYDISGTSVTVKTLDSGERAITTAISLVGNALNAQFVTKDSTNIYVSNGASFSEVMSFDIATQNFVSAFKLADPIDAVYPLMNSNLCQADGKLWAVGAEYSDATPQLLHSYNLSTTAKVATVIPVRPGSARSWIADGYNSSVYVTNYNNLSVTRFSYANVFGATIRVNSSPTRIFTAPDKSIYVSSFAGMLSFIDWDDDGVHNDWSTEGDCLSLDKDPTDTGFLWFCNGAAVARHQLNDHTQIELGEGTDDWVHSIDRFATFSLSESFTVVKSASITLAHQKLISTEYQVGSLVYHPLILVKNSAETVTLVEHVDYTVNTVTGQLQFLSTSTVVTHPTTPTSLKATYYYNNFNPDFSLVTAEKTYLDGATTVTVKPYVFIISNNTILAFRLDQYRTSQPVETGVTSQCAVVAGTTQYFGD